MTLNRLVATFNPDRLGSKRPCTKSGNVVCFSELVCFMMVLSAHTESDSSHRQICPWPIYLSATHIFLRLYSHLKQQALKSSALIWTLIFLLLLTFYFLHQVRQPLAAISSKVGLRLSAFCYKHIILIFQCVDLCSQSVSAFRNHKIFLPNPGKSPLVENFSFRRSLVFLILFFIFFPLFSCATWSSH